MNPAALAALNLGLSVVPPREDGSKAPLGCWKDYQTRLPTEVEVGEMYATGVSGLGLVTGQVSGGLELFEFDHEPTYRKFLERARKLGLGALVDRVKAGYSESTPGGGVHWLYYCPEVRGATKLAQHTVDGKIRVLIETKGEGGYVIVAPTNGKVHPNGGAYILLEGGLELIQTLTPAERDALWDLARSLDEVGKQKAFTALPRGLGASGRPGDVWAAKTAWEAILEPHGWQKVGQPHTNGEQFWAYPGATHVHSASTNYQGTDLLYVWGTSSVFKADTTYTKFGAYAVLEHGEDHGVAARTLRLLGFAEGIPSRAVTVVRDEVGLIGMTGDKASRLEIAEAKWVVPGLVVEGLTELAGAPKAGKSFLVANLAVGVVMGGLALGIRVEKMSVLALMLEDPLRRARERLETMLGGPMPNNLRLVTIETGLAPMKEGGLELVDETVARMGDVGLVIVDTFAVFAGQERSGSVYRGEYREWMSLKEVGDRHHCALLVTTHDSKSKAEDWLSNVSGTRGTTGAADTVMFLTRLLSNGGRLRVRGRDLEELDWALSFDSEKLIWRNLGSQEQYRHESLVAKVYELVRSGGQWTPTEIGDELDEERRPVSMALTRLVRQGDIRRVGRGSYEVVVQA